jgi:hypothetical protein
MSGRYLEKLRALKSEKGAVEEPTKLTEPCFVGFVSTQGTAFSNFPAGYGRTMTALESRCPYLVPVDRWQLAVEDGRRFLARWGAQAEALGWTARDLFGLHKPPEKPHPSYSRLSRYDETGLVWLLQGYEVVALTDATAAIQSSTGAITTYRRFNKPGARPAGRQPGRPAMTHNHVSEALR